MRNSTRTYLLLAFLSALFLSACTGDRLAANSWPGVTVTESNVYLAFGSHIYSLNAADGRVLWKFPQEAENSLSFFSSPGLVGDGGHLIAGAYDNSLYSLDAKTGQAVDWTFSDATSRYIADILTTEDKVFAANGDGNLYALDSSGLPLWDDPYSTGEPIWAAPTAVDGILYFASLDHKIHAVNMETGLQVWSVDLGTASSGVPVVVDGVLYTGTFGRKVYALDTGSGAPIWEFETEDWVFASVAVSDGTVYAGDISGLLYAIDAGSGQELWRFKTDGGIFGGPLWIDGIIHVGTDSGQFYALSADGEVEWFYSTNGKIYSPPRFNGEYIFISTLEGDVLITALDRTGTARWPFTPEE